MVWVLFFNVRKWVGLKSYFCESFPNLYNVNYFSLLIPYCTTLI